MTPRGDLPRTHSHHRAHLGSDRSQQMPPSTSKLSRRRAASNSTNSLHNRDLDSIRARRAKLEALTASVRLPPLIPSDINGVYSSSAALTYTPPKTHTASKQRLHRLRKGEHPITSISPGGSARLHRPSSKLPPLLARQMTPLHTPLPKIGPVAETSEQETKQTQVYPRNPTPSPSPEPQPSHVTPSPIISPISQEEKEKPNYFQIVQEMKGIENNDNITDPKNTAVTTGDTTAFANDTDANVTRNNTGINKATSNDTEPNTGNTLSDVTKLAATVKARKLMSTSDMPIEEFLEAGILEAAKMNLNNSRAKNTTTLRMTNKRRTGSWKVVGGATYNLQKAGLIKPLVQLVESGENIIKEQSVWALANIAAEGEGFRNKILEAGFLHHLIDFIRNHSTMSQLANSTWALSNIFRTPNWMLTNEEVTLAISVVKDICLSSENNKVLVDALWCLKNLTMVDSTIELVIDADILPLLTPHLKSPHQKVQDPAVRVVGNIVSATDVQTDAALEAGILAPIHNILKNSVVDNLRKEAAWVLSNITAGTTQQIQKLLDEGVLLTIYDVISKDSNNVVKEAAYVLVNLVVGGTTNQRKQFVDTGGVDSLASLIPRFQKESSLSAILSLALDAISAMLAADSDNVNKIKDQIEEGLDILLELRTHNDATVVSAVNNLLHEHFPDLEELNSGGGSDEENMDNTSLPGTASKYVAGE
ncbi:hypothetical protein Pmani_029128 [Petrolisthes manimaculis]|uniref:Importin subunit alpha n=1 Tax=Petrolisthes manimaculis TaxID=1843537 RepID=A0AAE1P0K9_9EUCA|nr:hypothetical protein Pmani_029128 [Petrolisthes manimaculis]